MKSSLIKKFNLFIYICSGLLIFSCSNEYNNEQSKKEYKTSVNNLSRTNSSDTLYLHIEKDNYDLEFMSMITEGVINSKLTALFNGDTLLQTTYNFDTKEEHWKLLQSNRVVEKSNAIKDKDIPVESLLEIRSILTENIGDIYNENIVIKNQYLISSINFHISIISTTLRSIKNNEECNCTVHPEFLMDKSFFNCQEDYFYETARLKHILYQYISENDTIDSSTSELIDYLEDYQEDKIRFDHYYSFYVSKEDFNTYITNQLAAGGDCAWWCPLGCGSDHGCCGNYSGCCLYWHIGCYVHDKICINCEPPNFCLPGCVPG